MFDRKAWREKNKEEHAKANHLWYLNNKDRVHAYNRKIGNRYCNLKCTARARNLILDITLEQYTRLVLNASCFYCQGPLSETGPSLDRLDNTLGYLLTNVVPCCYTCNWKKGRLEQVGFKYPRTVELMKELIQ